MKFLIAGLILVSITAYPQTAASDPDATFPPFQQWMAAVLTGDEATLKSLYSTNPMAQIRVKTIIHGGAADIDYWMNMKVRNMKVEIIRGTAPRPGITQLILHIDMTTPSSEQPISVTNDQVWQKQGEDWKLISVERTDGPKLKQPTDMKKDIYSARADAHADLKEAEQKAAHDHKRLLLVFGANWCFDCHVLDLAFEQPDLAPIIASNYEVVHVDLGPDGKKNADLAQHFEIPLDKGIPALAVADSDGKLVVSQKNGEFEDARGLTSDALAEFLNKWRPQAR